MTTGRCLLAQHYWQMPLEVAPIQCKSNLDVVAAKCRFEGSPSFKQLQAAWL